MRRAAIAGRWRAPNAPARLVADDCFLLRRGGAGEKDGGGVVAPTGRGDEDPALAVALRVVGDEGEGELVGKPGDRFVMVADNEGDVGEEHL